MNFRKWLTKVFGMTEACYYTLGSDDQEEILDRYLEWLSEN